MTLALVVPKQTFRKTIWLKMMHHHAKFGYKCFNSSEDIAQTKSFNEILILHCDLHCVCACVRACVCDEMGISLCFCKCSGLL